MSNQIKKASLLRTVFVSTTLVTILGLFLALYFFIYIPQQQTAYDKSTFRILEEISENFRDRVLGADTAAQRSDGVLTKTNIPRGNSATRDLLIQALKKNAGKDKNASAYSLSYLLNKNITDSLRTLVATIMQPIVELHSENFETVLLIKPDNTKDNTQKQGTIIFNQKDISFDNDVNLDTIYKKNSFFIHPVIYDFEAESVSYKLFLLPFSINDQRFVIGGLISIHEYKLGSRSFPILPLVILVVSLIILLTSLPFLKIFLLSPQESISVKDVRSIIAMVYIIPFVFIMLIACAWLYSRSDRSLKDSISSLHTQITNGFYTEIHDAIKQLKYYNTSLQKDNFRNVVEPTIKKIVSKQVTETDLKDASLHPAIYKNLDGLFWIDSAGKEIAKWNLSKDSVYFFDKKDRRYVKDIKNGQGYHLPEGYVQDTFSIQPTLAKSNGEYTVSIVTASNQSFGDEKAIMVGLSGKLYSIVNPVLPKGLKFCIIDQTGKTLFHSEYERNLQENIFEEVRNALPLKVAVSRNDSTMLNVKLYEKDVTLLISPIKGLPYHLIIYADERTQLLHIFHILSFTFLTQSLLLIFVALISLFFYYSSLKHSQLFFAENEMEFAKPSKLKKEYYSNLVTFHVTILGISVLLSLLFTGARWLFVVLNLSIQLPIFSIIGYYIFRCLDNNCALIKDANKSTKKVQVIKKLLADARFKLSMYKVLIPYFAIIILFQVYKNDLLQTSSTAETFLINSLLISIEILVPLFAVYLKIFGLSTKTKEAVSDDEIDESTYLRYFIKALLLSAIVTTMVPVTGLLLYAGNQEKILQLKSSQMYEATKIQERRVQINEKIAQTKLLQIPYYYSQDSLFIDSLKYSKSKGIYTVNDVINKDFNWRPMQDGSFADYGLYKSFTQFLFLPPDHPDFFNNRRDYYYWEVNAKDSGDYFSSLHYNNATDYKDKSHLVISSAHPHNPNTLSLFRGFDSLVLIGTVFLFICLFYKVLIAVSKRIFLIGYFEETPGKNQDKLYVNKKYFNGKYIEDPFAIAFWGTETVNTKLITDLEVEPGTSHQHDERILIIQTLLAQEYESIWSDLSPSEKYTIYDLATDGFTNYRNIDIIYSLYKKGLLKKDNHHLAIWSKSFRNFLVAMSGTPGIKQLKHDITEGGKWSSIRMVILVITFIAVVFLFVVQEEISKRVFAIATSLGALIPLLLKVFSNNKEGSTASGGDKKA